MAHGQRQSWLLLYLEWLHVAASMRLLQLLNNWGIVGRRMLLYLERLQVAACMRLLQLLYNCHILGSSMLATLMSKDRYQALCTRGLHLLDRRRGRALYTRGLHLL